jgi:hypothetical protein
MIFERIRDFSPALAAMSEDHPKDRVLRPLEAAWRPLSCVAQLPGVGRRNVRGSCRLRDGRTGTRTALLRSMVAWAYGGVVSGQWNRCEELLKPQTLTAPLGCIEIISLSEARSAIMNIYAGRT